MLTIRLARVGKKNRAQFHIVLQEHTIAPDGRHVEVLGSYDPHSKQAVLKDEKIKYWLSKGAKASDSVHNLLVSKNVISEKKIAVKISKKKKGEVTPAETLKAEGEAKAENKETEEVKTEEKPAEAKAEEAKEEVKEETKTEESKAE